MKIRDHAVLCDACTGEDLHNAVKFLVRGLLSKALPITVHLCSLQIQIDANVDLFLIQPRIECCNTQMQLGGNGLLV